jgi:hypothetical protein
MGDEGQTRAELPKPNVGDAAVGGAIPEREESSIPKWIKVGAGIVGILGGIATIGGTIYALIGQNHQFVIQLEGEKAKQEDAEVVLEREKKAVADSALEASRNQSAAAIASREEEAIKLEIAQLQLSQHKLDLQNQTQEKRDEAQRQERMKSGEFLKTEAQELSKLIDILLASKEPAEGTLAQLSMYTRQPELHAALLDALAVRLIHPNSEGEILITYSLLANIGPDSVNLLILSNRGARKRFDDHWAEVFWSTFVRNSSSIVANAQASIGLGHNVRVFEDSVLDQIETIVTDVSSQFGIPQSYLVADLSRDRFYRTLVDFRLLSSAPSEANPPHILVSEVVETIKRSGRGNSDVNVLESQMKLERLEILQSQQFLQEFFAQRDELGGDVEDKTAKMDLGSCYLADMKWDQEEYYPTLNLKYTYIGEMLYPGSMSQPISANNDLVDLNLLFTSPDSPFDEDTVASFRHWAAATFRQRSPFLRFMNGEREPFASDTQY